VVPAVVALHAGIWTTMGLNYWPMAATAAIVLVDWPDLLARARRGGPTGPPHADGRRPVVGRRPSVRSALTYRFGLALEMSASAESGWRSTATSPIDKIPIGRSASATTTRRMLRRRIRSTACSAFSSGRTVSTSQLATSATLVV